MGFSFKLGSLVGILLIEKTLKTGAICKEDQSRICRTLAEGGFSSDSHRHPNAGTCLSKRYSTFTHVCSVHDYSPSVAFCCCSAQTTQTTTSTSSVVDERILCCRYFQSWNAFRCDEERDVVPLANSTLVSVRVWTISLILFAVISLLTLLLIGCLRKTMANKKKNSSDHKSARLDGFPLDPEKHWHHHSSGAQDASFHNHYLTPGMFKSVVPLIPSAPSMDDTESYKEFSHYDVRRSTNDSNISTTNNNNVDSGAGDSKHKRAIESTSDSNNFHFDPDNDQGSSVFKTHREKIDVKCNMLRDSVCVESSIEINSEPPPPYDEVVASQ